MVEPGRAWSTKEERKLRRLKIDPAKSDPQRLEMFVRHFKEGGSLNAVVSGGIVPEYDETVSKGLGKKIRDLTKKKKLDWVLGCEEAKEEIQKDELSVKSVPSKPVVTIKGVYTFAEDGSTEMSKPVYFSHFVMSNEGKEAAIELLICLLDSDKYPLLRHRETVLNIGDKKKWRPNLNRSDGHYYLVCQYSTPTSDVRAELLYQTWLQFNLIQADKSGEVYVAPKPLMFKDNILPGEKISAFQ